MNTTALQELRTLRAQEKTIKQRISQIAGDAAQEAALILADQGRDRGEFTTPDGQTFQLQATDKYDFGNYSRYKDPECINWRAYAKQKALLQDKLKAVTKAMDAQLKMWISTHRDSTPDATEYTVKCVE